MFDSKFTSLIKMLLLSIVVGFLVNIIEATDADCGKNQVVGNLWYEEQVMGGENATEGQWPWMAAIREKDPEGYYVPSCSGFFVTRRYVISAAHCFDRRDPRNYRIRAGRVNQDEGEEYNITRITIPQDYRRNYFYNDIAILTLNRDVNTPNFIPICMPDDQIRRMDLIGMGTTIAGWGAEKPRGPLSRILKQLQGLTVVSNKECANKLRGKLRNFQRLFPRGLSNGFMCAGLPGGGRDSCGGDSGGPLMLQDRNRWFAVGIVSFGISCGEPDVPGGYIRVSRLMAWIRQYIKDI